MQEEEEKVEEVEEVEEPAETETTEEAPSEPDKPDYSEIITRIDDLEKFIGDVFEKLSTVMLKSGAVVDEAEEDYEEEIKEEYQDLEDLDYTL